MSSINPRYTDNILPLLFPTGLQTIFLNSIIVTILYFELFSLLYFAKSQHKSFYNPLQLNLSLVSIGFGLFSDAWAVFLFVYAQFWILQKIQIIYSECSMQDQFKLHKKLTSFRIFLMLNLILFLTVPIIFLVEQMYMTAIELVSVFVFGFLSVILSVLQRMFSKIKSVLTQSRVQKGLVFCFIFGIVGSSVVVINSGLKPHSKLSIITQATGITDLTIISYNIRTGTAHEKNSLNDWANRKGNLTMYLDSFNADIFCVQEALLFQIEYLQTHLKNRSYSYTGFGRDNGFHEGEHVAILFDSTKYEFVEGDTFWLSDTPLYPSRTWENEYLRICTWARFEVIATGIQFCVFNSHFDFYDLFFEQASKLIHSRIVDYSANLPVFMMGDFNTQTTASRFQYLENYGDKPLVDSYRIANNGIAPNIASYNNFTPTNTGGRIDFILVSQNVNVKDCQIPHDSYGQNQTYSDHYPVVLTCNF